MDESAKAKVAKMEVLIRRELGYWLRGFVYVSYPFLLMVSIILVDGALFPPETSTEREASRVETIIVGGNITRALQEYRGNHSQYPDSLEELAPTYLQRITQPSWGDSGWLYKKLEADFVLEVGFECGGEILYPVMLYTASYGRWHVNQ
jgi:hypothetical protein